MSTFNPFCDCIVPFHCPFEFDYYKHLLGIAPQYTSFYDTIKTAMELLYSLSSIFFSTFWFASFFFFSFMWGE